MPRIIPCPACGQLNRLPDDRTPKAAHCPSCQSALFLGKPVELTAANFDRQVKSADLPVVVDFWASWCGPCRAMAPVFEQAAAELDTKIRFGKVDTDAEQAIAARFHIQSIPTLIVFRGGREIARQAGAISGSDLRRWLNQTLSA